MVKRIGFVKCSPEISVSYCRKNSKAVIVSANKILFLLFFSSVTVCDNGVRNLVVLMLHPVTSEMVFSPSHSSWFKPLNWASTLLQLGPPLWDLYGVIVARNTRCQTPAFQGDSYPGPIKWPKDASFNDPYITFLSLMLEIFLLIWTQIKMLNNLVLRHWYFGSITLTCKQRRLKLMLLGRLHQLRVPKFAASNHSCPLLSSPLKSEWKSQYFFFLKRTWLM